MRRFLLSFAYSSRSSQLLRWSLSRRRATASSCKISKVKTIFDLRHLSLVAGALFVLEDFTINPKNFKLVIRKLKLISGDSSFTTHHPRLTHALL